MSSSGRYQSRLFTWINRQSLRWGDRWERQLRQVKVASVWGVQALFYPLYLIFQGTRVGQKTLGQNLRQGWWRLRAVVESETSEAQVTADSPLRQVLQSIELIPLPPQSTPTAALPAIAPEPGYQILIHPAASAPSTPGLAQLWERVQAIGRRWLTRSSLKLAPAAPLPLAAPSGALASIPQSAALDSPGTSLRVTPQIQGLATSLSNRNLVLVTDQNQLLDLLTPQQQQQLQQAMIAALAHYYQQRRQWPRAGWRPSAAQLQTRRSLLPPQLPVDRPTLLPPVRRFRQLMAWLQLGPVASAINLFRETSLIQAQPTHGGMAILPRDSRPRPHQLLPRPIIVQVDRAIATWEADPVGLLLDLSLGVGTASQQFLQWLQHQLRLGVKPDFPPAPPTPGSPPMAAVPLPPWVRLPSVLQTALASLAHPRALLRRSSPIEVNPTVAAPAPEGMMTPRQPWLTWADLFRQTPPQRPVQDQSQAIVLGGSESLVPPSGSSTPWINSLRRQPSAVAARSPAASPATANPSLDLEAEVVVVGYDKHPLELILEWLDRSILWLEAAIAFLWRHGSPAKLLKRVQQSLGRRCRP